MSSDPILVDYPQRKWFFLAFFVCWNIVFFLLAAFAFKFWIQCRNFLEDRVGLILHSPRCLLPSPAKANWIIFNHFLLDLCFCYSSRYSFCCFYCVLGRLLGSFLLSSFPVYRRDQLFRLRLFTTYQALASRLLSFSHRDDDGDALSMFVVSITYLFCSLALHWKLKEATNIPPIALQIGSGASVVGVEAVLSQSTLQVVAMRYGQQAQVWLDSLPDPGATRFSEWSALLHHCRCGRRIVMDIIKDSVPAS